jgi:hypothetical protein
MIFLSLDSGTDAQCAALRNEVDGVSGCHDLDPLSILMREEEEGTPWCECTECKAPIQSDGFVWDGLCYECTVE